MGVENLIDYCNKLYNNADTSCRCKDCINECKGSCEKCLESIHFGDNRRYNCMNIMNYYVCKYSYKYLSEIGKIFSLSNIIDNNDVVSIISIGCGPCTDLLGVKQYINNEGLTIKLKYRGIDLNDNWRHIHEYLKNDFNQDDIKFIYDDVFNVLNAINTIGKYDILFLQYLISDMIKYNNDDEMKDFINKLVDKIISKMSVNSFIIINDINHMSARKYFEQFLSSMDENKVKYTAWRYHFNNDSRESHYNYGYEYEDNKLICVVNDDIKESYNPWVYCSSAQIIIRRD